MDFKEKQQSLRDSSFTDNFNKGNIALDVLLYELDLKVDLMEIYQDGGIMSQLVDLTESNKKLLEGVIKDFDAYYELVELEFNSAHTKEKLDMISLLHFSQEVLRMRITYDRNEEFFHYAEEE